MSVMIGRGLRAVGNILKYGGRYNTLISQNDTLVKLILGHFKNCVIKFAFKFASLA